jgi:hypothetical protein
MAAMACWIACKSFRLMIRHSWAETVHPKTEQKPFRNAPDFVYSGER